ncbi:hypothetical protein SynA1560_00728 [Synechococcus sp. A15-60]|nr:hypothetical protein SynA1560_00728 [Synechococcus sp. A15-60]
MKVIVLQVCFCFLRLRLLVFRFCLVFQCKDWTIAWFKAPSMGSETLCIALGAALANSDHHHRSSHG